jgi:lipopolysaccharide assembly protein A
MKGQWNLLLGLLFALIVALFAVINVNTVVVDFLFVEKAIPLILIILGSVFMGGMIVGSVGMYRMFKLQREIKLTKKEKAELEEKLSVFEQAEEKVSEVSEVTEVKQEETTDNSKNE